MVGTQMPILGSLTMWMMKMPTQKRCWPRSTCAGFCPATPDAARPCEDGAGMGEGSRSGRTETERGGKERERIKGHFVFRQAQILCQTRNE
jgi:hypothetical protein